MSDFRRWVEHFERNAAGHALADTAIPFGSGCALAAGPRAALTASVQRFQIGESGDGTQLLRKAARHGDPGYLQAAQLFVAEEQQHADLLGRLLDHLGAAPLTRHWSDTVFVALRRALGLRTELMVLTVAEVVALSYYAALAEAAPDAATRAVAARILADERSHVPFQCDRLTAAFAGARAPVRLLARALWWLTALATAVVVAADHRPALRLLGYPPSVFVRDVLGDFAAVVATVLAR